MDRLHLLTTFVAVARAGSFSVAAEQLRLSRPAVTKQIVLLENLLQAQLLNRTTHSVSLTDAGLSLLEKGEVLLRDFDALESHIRDATADPRGVIRIGTPPSFAISHLVPAVHAFKAEYPDIQVLLFADTGTLDIVKNGLDFSIRIFESMRDVNSISRLLTRVPQVLVASPLYLKDHPAPRSPADLVHHNCLVHSVKSPSGIWRFKRGDEIFRVRVTGSISANFGAAISAAALVGEGISLRSMHMVEEHLRTGRLQVVMSDYESTSLEIRAIYSRRELPARVLLFLSFLRTWVRRETQWPQSSSAISQYERGAGEESDALDAVIARPRRANGGRRAN